MNTNERILKLKIGGRSSRDDFRSAEAEYQEAITKLDNDASISDIEREDRKAKATAYLTSYENTSSADAHTNYYKRHGGAEAYRIAASMIDGTFDPAKVKRNTGSRYGANAAYGQAGDTAVAFMNANKNRGAGNSSSGTESDSDYKRNYNFQWNAGLSGGIEKVGATRGGLVKSYAEGLLKNLLAAQTKESEGYHVGNKISGMYDDIASLQGFLQNGDFGSDAAYNSLVDIASRYDPSGKHWRIYFGKYLPKVDPNEERHQERLAAGLTDYDLADQSQTVRDFLKNRNLIVMRDGNNNMKVFNKDWTDYTGGDFVDYNDDWTLVGTDGKAGERGYHHGVILNNGQLHLGDLDQLADSDPIKLLYLNEQASRVSRRDPLVEQIRWNAVNSDTDDDFIRLIADDAEYKDKNFAGADVSQLFRGLDERIFAVNGAGKDIFKRDVDGNITFNEGTKFYTRDEEGNLVRKSWNDLKSAYHRDGFNEGKQLKTMYEWDENIDDVQSSIDLDSDMGGRGYWDASSWNSNLWKNMFRSGKDFAAWWKAGLLGNPFSYNSMDNINEDKQGFVLNLLNAINDQKGKLKINLAGVDGNTDLLNKLGYFEKLDDYNALLIQLLEKNKSVDLETLKEKEPQLYKTYMELKNRYFRKHGKRQVVQAKKEGGKVTFAAMGTVIDGNGEDVTHPKYAERTRAKILKNLDRYNEDESAARQAGYDSKYQMDANKKGAFKGDGVMTTSDMLRLGSMAQDVASVVASFVAGAGTGVAAGLGVTAMGTDLLADIIDPAVSAGEVAKNAAINAGFAALGMVPGAKAGKVLKNCIKWAPRIMMAAGAMNIAMDDSTHETFAKLANGGKDFNRQDWRNLSHVISLVAAGTRGAKGAYDRHKVRSAGAGGGDEVKLKGIKSSVNNEDMILPKKQIDSINEKLGKAETLEDAKAVLAGEKTDSGADLFTPKQIEDLITNNGWKGKVPGRQKFELNTEKMSVQTSEAAKGKAYDNLRALWNEDAAALQRQSKSGLGRAAIWFANKFGGGAYGANQRAILMEGALNPEVVAAAMDYTGKYNPMIDWKGLRGMAATEMLRERTTTPVTGKTPEAGVSSSKVRKMLAHKRSTKSAQLEPPFNGGDELAGGIQPNPEILVNTQTDPSLRALPAPSKYEIMRRNLPTLITDERRMLTDGTPMLESANRLGDSRLVVISNYDEIQSKSPKKIVLAEDVIPIQSNKPALLEGKKTTTSRRSNLHSMDFSKLSKSEIVAELNKLTPEQLEGLAFIAHDKGIEGMLIPIVRVKRTEHGLHVRVRRSDGYEVTWGASTLAEYLKDGRVSFKRQGRTPIRPNVEKSSFELPVRTKDGKTINLRTEEVDGQIKYYVDGKELNQKEINLLFETLLEKNEWRRYSQELKKRDAELYPTANKQLMDIASKFPSIIDGHRVKLIPFEDGAVVSKVVHRPIVLVEIDGKRIPFYVSTGSGGKKNVATGKWYPIFGVGEDGWFNKSSEADINRYYDSKVLKSVAQTLDQHFGDLRRHKGLKDRDWFSNLELNNMHKDIGEGFMNGMSSARHQQYLDRIKNIVSWFGDKYQHVSDKHKQGGQINYNKLRK